MKHLLPLLALLPSLLFAQNKWSELADTRWYTNAGNSDNYTISTAEELAGLATIVNGGIDNFYNKTINLAADIVLNDTDGWEDWNGSSPGLRQWTSIGASLSLPFKGTFDGDGYVVSGVYMSSSLSYYGLFGYIDGGSTIKNLGVVASYIKGTSYVGGLVGNNSNGTITNSYATGNVNGTNYVGGLAGYNGATISNSYATGNVVGTSDYVGGLVGNNFSTVSNSYATGNVSGTDNVGGLVGYDYGPITNSYATGNVNGTTYVGGLAGRNFGAITNGYATGGVSGNGEVGGLVGNNNNGTITNSYATGNVSGATSGSGRVGGLVGSNTSGVIIITNSYATGNVLGKEKVGGLVGYHGKGTISNSYATGNVKGTVERVGGLVGDNVSTITNSYATGSVEGTTDNTYNLGGLVGYHGNDTISNSYATGNVKRTNEGGLVGYNGINGVVTSSYYNSDNSGQTDTTKGTPKTTAQMQTQDTYVGWDFEEVWGIVTGFNDGMPYLKANFAKANPIYELPTNLTATYGQTLVDVTLSGNWSWMNIETSVGNAGTRTHLAKFMPANTDNYNTIENINVEVTVSKANPAVPPEPTDLTATYGQTLADVTLSGNWSWMNIETSVGNAGTRTHTAKFTPADTANYNTIEENVTVTVFKANPIYDLPANLTATYGQTLEDVALSGNWSWMNIETSVGSAGTQTHKAKFTPEDTGNYNTLENINVVITVSKANPIYDPPTGLTATYGQTLANVELSGNWSWMDAAASVGDVGTQTHKATFTPEDTGNYNSVAGIDVTVTVAKATPPFPSIDAISTAYEEGLKLGSISLPEGYSWVEPNLSLYPGSSQKLEAVYALSHTHPIAGTVTVNVSKNPGSEPAFPAISVNATFRNGLALENIALPSGYAWSEPSTKITSPGDGQQFNATHTNNRYAQPSAGKITVNASAGAGVVAISGWSYGETPNIPLAETITNGAATLLYTGKTNSGTSYSSTQPPSEAGRYTLTATFAAKGGSGEIVRTAEFAIEKSEGTGAVRIDGWKSGSEASNPLAESETNGAENVSYIYRSTDGASYAPSPSKPSDAGNYILIAIFPETNNYTEARDTTYFTISKPDAIELTVFWSDNGVFTYNKMAPHPVPTAEHNGTDIPLIVLKTRSEAGEYRGVTEAIAMIANEAVRTDYILKNSTRSYTVEKKPLVPRFTVKKPIDAFDAKEDTVWVPSSIFSNPALLRSILAELVDYTGFARDTVRNESDNASVLSGSPRVEVVYENPGFQSALHRRVETTRKATAIIVTEDVTAKNYELVKTSVTVVETVEEDEGERQVSCVRNFNCAPMSGNSCLAIGGEAVASCTMRCSVGNACAPMPVGSCAIMEGEIVDICPGEPSEPKEPGEPIEPVRRPVLSGGSLRIWQTASGMVNVDLGYMPAAPVVLQVYDLKGKLVAAERVNTRFASVRVSVPSGVYLFKAGNRVLKAAVALPP